MPDDSARKIVEQCFKPGNFSWYNFKVGKTQRVIDRSCSACLEQGSTDLETGYTFLRLSAKGHEIKIFFKPENLVFRSSLLPGGLGEPIQVCYVETGLLMMSDNADMSINRRKKPYYAYFNNAISNQTTGYTLLRFNVKGHAMDIIFKTNDVAISSTLLPGGLNELVPVDSVEAGLRMISEAAYKANI